MEGVKKAMDEKITKGLLRLEQRMMKERQELLVQEELLWLQKSRQGWLKHGGENTKYFHPSTLIRRK